MTTSTTIYLRAFLPFSAMVVIAMLVAWWVAAALLTNALKHRVHDQLAHATGVLSSGAFPITADLLEQFGRLQNAHFALLRADGSIGPSTLDDGADAPLRAMIERAWENPGMGFEHFELVFEPLQPGRTGGHVAIAGLASLHDVEAAAQSTAVSLGLLSLLGIAVVAWLGHRLSIAITEPIRELRDMAQRIAAGDRLIQAKIPPIREIGELTEALNEMTGKLAEYERELVASSRMASLGEMSARIAHEIRNPLTAMKLQVQLLGEHLAGDDRDIAERLLGEIQRLQLIVSSTLEHGRTTLIEPARCTLDRVLAEVAQLMGPQFSHRGIELQTDLEEVPPLLLDADRLKQVLFNLLTNAANVLPNGGTVCVSLRLGQQQVHIDVEDSGPGLNPASAAAWDPQPAVASRPLGHGFGLVVSREIVELHGGTIEAGRSERLGGARFTVQLPATACA